MVFVEMAGRCGNQLFHYAVGRYVQIKSNDCDLCLNFNQVYKKNAADKGWYNVLNEYKVVPFQEYKKPGTILKNETNIVQKLLVGLKAIDILVYRNASRNLKAQKASRLQKLLNSFGIYWIREGVNNITVTKHNNSIVSGICEASFIYEIQDILQKELEPISKPLEYSIPLIEKMGKTNSVCVSVRRGDFLTNENAKSFLVCDLNYFLSAKKAIDDNIENPQYYVFSDDIEWCKHNLFTNCQNVEYISQTIPVYETLRLMYNCKHFILSNSTFSWWGQFLSKNANKCVVSPARWNNDGYETCLIDREKWILIE